MNPSRFVPAALVDFSGERLGRVDVAGPKRKLTAKDRQIRRKLRRARALKQKIAHLRIRKPLGWKGAVKNAKTNLRVVMSDLKMLGWKPKKPSRPRKPGEDEMDAALDDIPEVEPGEQEEPDEELDALPESPEAETEGNWLDGYVGVEPKPTARKRPKVNFLDAAARLVRGVWRPFDHLGENARIQTRTGQSAMITTVKPGLFIVQIVSDAAGKKIAGDNVGILPLLLFPLVKNTVQKALAPKPAPAAQPAAPAAQPAPAPATAGIGCEPCRERR
jgi:hypothetical protein